MILDNGVVRTLDPQLPVARALAIAGELVAGGVGVHETALASPEVVDLRGRCVLPGFQDAHVHFPTWALARQELRLEGARTRDEALELVAAAATGPGWLRGYGWRDADWPEPPTRASLDAVTGGRPAILVSKDGHTLWVNSAAGADTGEDGLLREDAAWAFRAEHGTPSADETVEAMRLAQKVAAARGVTAIHDMDGWRDALPLWQRLRATTLVTLRVWLALPPERLPELHSLGLRGGFGDDMLRIGYVKAFADGTLGSGTALMLGGGGMQLLDRDELEQIVRRAAGAGLSVAVHAIGDAANRLVLDAFEATRDAWAPLGLRQRIEHAQCLAPEDVPRFARLGVAASVQFSHAVSDRDLADARWGDRLDGAYAFRSLVDSGALVANGSDAPVEELDPWAGICAAVRRTGDERPPWRPEQALTLEQALAATCRAPAWLAGDERRRGRLLPGRAADLVVLDRDPFPLPPDELPDVRVVATMVGGRWTHNPPPWDES